MERRQLADRRSRPTPPLGKFWLRGRRRGPRRVAEKQTNYFVDRYSPATLFIVLTIVALSILDAFFTLYLIEHGAAEINPVMAHFLELGPAAFLAAKYMLTISSVILLLIYKNVFIFRSRLRASVLFAVFMGIFLAVVLWEVYLILFVVD